MKKDWLKKIKTEPAADVDTDYDQDYYSYGNTETAKNTEASHYNEFEDDDISGVRIVMSDESATEVAKAEVLLKTPWHHTLQLRIPSQAAQERR